MGAREHTVKIQNKRSQQKEHFMGHLLVAKQPYWGVVALDSHSTEKACSPSAAHTSQYNPGCERPKLKQFPWADDEFWKYTPASKTRFGQNLTQGSETIQKGQLCHFYASLWTLVSQLFHILVSHASSIFRKCEPRLALISFRVYIHSFPHQGEPAIVLLSKNTKVTGSVSDLIFLDS